MPFSLLAGFRTMLAAFGVAAFSQVVVAQDAATVKVGSEQGLFAMPLWQTGFTRPAGTHAAGWPGVRFPGLMHAMLTPLRVLTGFQW